MAGAGYKLFNTGDVLTAAQVNTYLQEQTVMVFADAAARTTALSGVLAEGMMSYLKSTDSVEVYNGSAWVSVSSDQTPLTTKGDLFTFTTTDARLAVGNNGETLVADSSASTGLRWQANVAAGRNAAINGGQDIWQRGTSFTTTAAYVYCSDRWYYSRSAGNTTVSRQTDAPSGFQYSIRLARNSGDTNTSAFTFHQALETSESMRFAGQAVTFSFWAKAGANYSAGAIPTYINTGTGTDQAATGQNAGTWTGFTSPLNGSTFTPTTSWVRYSFTATIGSTATQIGFGFLTPSFSGTAGANDWVQFTGLQFELGSVATNFSRAGATLAGELAACQRYYEKSFPIGTAPANSVGGGPMQGGAAGWIAYDANNVRSMPILFKVNKRTSPTITTYNTSDIATAGKWAYYTGSAWADAGGNAGSNINETGFYVTGNNSGAYTQHRPYLLAGNWTAEAEL